MFELWDSFNDQLISRHRTVEAAVKARRAHARAVEAHNGPGSFIHYAILKDGKMVGEDEIDQVEDTLDHETGCW
jgi:hypothetical protein